MPYLRFRLTICHLVVTIEVVGGLPDVLRHRRRRSDMLAYRPALTVPKIFGGYRPPLFERQALRGVIQSTPVASRHAHGGTSQAEH